MTRGVSGSSSSSSAAGVGRRPAAALLGAAGCGRLGGGAARLGDGLLDDRLLALLLALLGRLLLGADGVLGGDLLGLVDLAGSVSSSVAHRVVISIGFGLLGGVGMLRPGVDLQLGDLLARQAVAGQHALDGEADDLFGPPLEHLVERAALDAARVARVAVVALLLALLARHGDLLGVDDDDEVAHVAVRRVRRLALAAQQVGELGRQAAEVLALGVDEHPVALAIGGCGDVGLHGVETPGHRPARRRIDSSGLATASEGGARPARPGSAAASRASPRSSGSRSQRLPGPSGA